jgi:hypothetical protein
MTHSQTTVIDARIEVSNLANERLKIGFVARPRAESGQCLSYRGPDTDPLLSVGVDSPHGVRCFVERPALPIEIVSERPLNRVALWEDRWGSENEILEGVVPEPRAHQDVPSCLEQRVDVLCLHSDVLSGRHRRP